MIVFKVQRVDPYIRGQLKDILAQIAFSSVVNAMGSDFKGDRGIGINEFAFDQCNGFYFYFGFAG